MEFDTYYHIYNRANGNEKMFASRENHLFFLRRYKHFIAPICHTLSYCLMTNHFHFLIRIKSEEDLKTIESFEKAEDKSKYLSKQFSNLFSSYTQAFNKQHRRRGSLFMRAFKRKEVKDDDHFRRLVLYIHFNPVNAGICSHPKEYEHSSYNSIISDKPTLLNRQEVIEYFDSLENFEFVHNKL